MSNDMMEALVNKVIKINRGGPESLTGKLLETGNDFLILLSQDDGVTYMKNQHIKSISENSKDSQKFNSYLLETLDYKTAYNFSDLMDNLRYQWVKINRGGPEKVEGVLYDVSDDFVTVIKNEEIVRVSMYHIRSISYGLKAEKNQVESNN
ncbi:hypothetical protein KDN24_07265 [Bacillus sp. Bva_UNVM-123]|uniref:hypothetical protein n=1 Tax=Bacillus sp. Bva_UNVM-123 TaxID=2829798 RepID=UPI00391FA8AD